MSNPDQYKRREIEKMAARAVLALKYITEQDRYKQTEPSCTDATALNFDNTDNIDEWRDLHRCVEEQFDWLPGSRGDAVGSLKESKPKISIDEIIKMALEEETGKSYMWQVAEDDTDGPRYDNMGTVSNWRDDRVDKRLMSV